MGGLRPERHRGTGVTDLSIVFNGGVAEGVRESLCTLGNGYLATRRAAPTGKRMRTADDRHLARLVRPGHI
jgi:hypothetical protein